MITLTQRAVIYCRVSTKEQVEEGNSLSTQERVCREYADKNGYQVVEVYVEEGESAKTTDRPQINKMMDFCSKKRNDIQAIIAYKIDRISRNMDDYSRIRMLLKKYGVEIKSTSEKFENTPVGRFLENTLASIGEFDNSIRAERCGNGMKEAVREGRYVWMAPIGYKNIRIGGKATIAPSALAPVILQTFERIAQGVYPTDEVRKMMYREGLMNANGKPIARAYFYTLLKNKLYTGIIEKFGEIHRGNFEPILSEQLFNQVQDVLRYKGKRAVIYQRDREDFPLRRFLYHPSGIRLSGCWSKGANGTKYAYYRYATIPGCNYKAEPLQKMFTALWDRYSLSSDDTRALIGKVKEVFLETTKEQRKDQELLNKRLHEIQDRETLLVEKNLKGIIPDEVAQQQLSLLKNERVDIRSQLYAHETIGVDVKEVLNVAEEFLVSPSCFWEKADLDTKLQLQKFAFPQGILFDGNEMRTDEISFLFKAKTAFFNAESARVDYQFIIAKRFVLQCEYLHKILTGKMQLSTCSNQSLLFPSKAA